MSDNAIEKLEALPTQAPTHADFRLGRRFDLSERRPMRRGHFKKSLRIHRGK